MSGPLPAGWRTCRLGDLAVEGPTNGYSGPTAPDARGTPTLRLSATTSGSLILNDSTTKRLTETIPSESELWLQPGDLLVQRSNTPHLVGTAAVYDGPPATYVYPDLMMRLRLPNPATAAWVCRYMNSPAGRRFFTSMAAGSSGSMPKISGAKLREMPVPVPPLPEQRRIAAVLDEADALRRKRRETFALLDDLLRATFLDMFGDPVSNPRGWPVVAFGEVLSAIQSGWSPTCESRPARDGEWGVLKLGAVTTGRFIEAHKALPEGLVAPEELEVQAGDVLFTRKNTYELVGAAAYVHRVRPKLLIPDLVFRLRLDLARLDPGYVATCLMMPAKRREVQSLAAGSAGSMPGISKARLATTSLPLPPLAVQARFASWVRQHEAQRERVTTAAEHTDALFTSLLDRAFAGGLRGPHGS